MLDSLPVRPRCVESVDLAADQRKHSSVVFRIVSDSIPDILHIRSECYIYTPEHSVFIILISPDHTFLDIRYPADLFFKLFRENVLAVGCNNYVLPAARDVNVIIRVQMADIPCMEPAVFHACSRRFRVLIVSHHDLRTAEADLSVAVFVFVYDLAVCELEQFACRFVSHVFPLVRIERDHRRCLRQSVSLQTRDPHAAEESEDLRVYSGSAGYEHVDTSAELCHDLIRYRLRDIDTESARKAVDGEQSVDQLVFALFLQSFLYRIVELLVDQRNSEQECRSYCLHILGDVLESSAECHRGSHKAALEHRTGAFISMMYRKHAEEDIFRAYLQISLRDQDV